MSQFYKVTQLKSAIALPAIYKENLVKLGLLRRGQTVYHDITPQQAGMIAKVKELVKVELVSEKLTKEQMRNQRRSDPGFTVEKRS